jgi:hypothetical protein
LPLYLLLCLTPSLQEYQAVKIVRHPAFNPSRLDNNMAIITVDKVIDLTNPTVNTACLPSCDDQFDFRLVNIKKIVLNANKGLFT